MPVSSRLLFLFLLRVLLGLSGVFFVSGRLWVAVGRWGIRQAIRPTIGLMNRPEDSAALRGRVEMEHPDKLIDSFRGAFEVAGAGADGGPCRYAKLA